MWCHSPRQFQQMDTELLSCQFVLHAEIQAQYYIVHTVHILIINTSTITKYNLWQVLISYIDKHNFPKSYCRNYRSTVPPPTARWSVGNPLPYCCCCCCCCCCRREWELMKGVSQEPRDATVIQCSRRQCGAKMDWYGTSRYLPLLQLTCCVCRCGDLRTGNLWKFCDTLS